MICSLQFGICSNNFSITRKKAKDEEYYLRKDSLISLIYGFTIALSKQNNFLRISPPIFLFQGFASILLSENSTAAVQNPF